MVISDFGSLLVKQNSFLHKAAIKLTRNEADIDDLIQDTFFKALKNRKKFEMGTNIKGWLFTIMRNTFINKCRKKKFQNTFVDETESKYYINSSALLVQASSESRFDNEYVLEQIAHIDKSYREIFMMHFEGYKYEEIANKFNIPLGTVKSRIFLARRKMKKELKEYYMCKM